MGKPLTASFKIHRRRQEQRQTIGIVPEITESIEEVKGGMTETPSGTSLNLDYTRRLYVNLLGTVLSQLCLDLRNVAFH